MWTASRWRMWPVLRPGNRPPRVRHRPSQRWYRWGYSQSEAALAISKIDATLPVEEIIKLALRGMAGRR